MILAVDAGNTRIKWGLYDSGRRGDHAWLSLGSLPNAELHALDERWRSLPVPGRSLSSVNGVSGVGSVSRVDSVSVVISNVAGETTRSALEAALQHLPAHELRVRWVSSTASACGIRNLYDKPEQLGSDRWAALIGAWRRHHGASLVVSCGTATTVDRLSAEGAFLGGLILPGAELMKKALMEHTAHLGLYAGRFGAEPRNTADAIASGCLHAQAGAIERMARAAGADAVCMITGGAAVRVMPLLETLAPRLEHIEHLTLEGLVALAQ